MDISCIYRIIVYIKCIFSCRRKILTQSKKRTIIFFDVDCFEVQLWLKQLRPDFIGKDIPIVVVNPDNVILSVNYTAKSLGIKRGVGRQCLQDAYNICKQNIVRLEKIVADEKFGKVDSFITQTESDKILNVIQNYLNSFSKYSPEIPLQRNSKDEFYIDVTELLQIEIQSISKISKLTKSRKQHPNSKYHNKPTTVMEIWGKNSISDLELQNLTEAVYPISYKNPLLFIKRNLILPLSECVTSLCRTRNPKQRKMGRDEISLVQGAIIAQNIMDKIKYETGYDLSAGVAHSKLVAKLACSRNKPTGITIIADSSLAKLGRETPFQNLPGYGGDKGSKIKNYYENKTGPHTFKIETIEQLLLAKKKSVNFQRAFKDLQIPNAWIKAKELDDLCNFRDNSPVDSITHSKRFSTSMSFKDCNSSSNFNKKITNLSHDMRVRIWYNLNNGRKATQLVVKADVKKNFKVTLGDFNNKLELGRRVSSVEIDRFIHEYCKQNKLDDSNVWKLYVTAGDIEETDTGWSRKKTDIFQDWAFGIKEYFLYLEWKHRNLWRVILAILIFFFIISV